MVSKPGGDRGPAVGYKNHMNAFQNDSRFQIEELTQEIISNPIKLNNFDIIWAYVRFHPNIFNYFKSLGKIFIGGPNVLFERGDLGPTDEWEHAYCNLPNLDFHINNSHYYLEHVKKFINKNTKTFVHEACYNLNDLPEINNETKRTNDVLVYVKKRVNDDDTHALCDRLTNLLDSKGITYKTLEYGKYDRKDFLQLAKTSKSCVWLSIEDYCSLAQIESHLCGCPIIGTDYNLTIPVSRNFVVKAQDFNHWIEWKSPDVVAQELLGGIESALSIDDIANFTTSHAIERHSYKTYTQKIFDEVKKL